MIRSLFIIAAAGLVLAIVCLGGAAALGGRELVRDGWVVNGDGWSLVQGDFEWESDDHVETVTRDIEWTGAQALTFDLAARVIYAQSDTPTVTVAGPSEVVQRVRFEDGRFWLEGADQGLGSRSRPRITVMAPEVSGFTLNGAQDLEIRDYDRPGLAVTINGSGDVEAWGRADSVQVAVNGSGDVDLDHLTVADAVIVVSGSGDVDAAPTGQADVTVSGSGDVELSTRPARLNSQVSGSGRVRQAD